MLSLLKKYSPEIQRRINSNLDLKYTPKLSFELDTSIEQGHRVLDLLAEIEATDGPDTDTDIPTGNPEANVLP